MSDALTGTYGVEFISFIIATMLYGIALLQTWLYFQWYTKDSWLVKIFILVLCLVETLQTAMFSWIIYWYLIENFGDVENLGIMTRVESAYLFLTFLSAFMVQCYFAHSIWRLIRGENEDRRPWIVLLICILALISIGAGIVQIVRIVEQGRYALLDTVEARTNVPVQAGAALACDVTITIALCVTLHNSRMGMRTTDSMLNKLIMYAINRGTLTSICACANMILFLAIPNTFWFFLGLRTGSKVYMNSMLATLNTREYIKHGRPNTRQDADGLTSICLTNVRYVTSFPPSPSAEGHPRPESRSASVGGQDRR